MRGLAHELIPQRGRQTAPKALPIMVIHKREMFFLGFNDLTMVVRPFSLPSASLGCRRFAQHTEIGKGFTCFASSAALGCHTTDRGGLWQAEICNLFALQRRRHAGSATGLTQR